MSSYIPVDLQGKIRAHFASCCAYCCTTEALTVAIFEIEHIIPRSAGGGTVYENLCLACPTCNRYKAARQLGGRFSRAAQFNCYATQRNFSPQYLENYSEVVI